MNILLYLSYLAFIIGWVWYVFLLYKLVKSRRSNLGTFDVFNVEKKEGYKVYSKIADKVRVESKWPSFCILFGVVLFLIVSINANNL